MNKRREENASTPKPSASRTAPTNRAKLWGFRLTALLGLPLILLGTLELGLRVAGFGYRTEFWLAATHKGQTVLMPNNQFGWRFFGSELARLPQPVCITPTPENGTIRILLFGESAAKGDPDPHFGLARILEATLNLRHPGVRFEVVNTAMTAINSHVILPIARDCAEIPSNVWVIYMGNNEVVGPFGAGTVFGQQSPALPVIRGSLALKTTRTGQWLDSALQRAWISPLASNDWGGMEMFLEQQVRADDPRMKRVYHHFERNLADIIQAGRSCGAGIVVSTVAVNVRDCAPFASAHPAGFSMAQQSRWDEIYGLGVKAQEAGKWAEATEHFRSAAELDSSFAELRFRQGQCALVLGRIPEAQSHFQTARDLDTLRFRCDSHLNERTRNAVARLDTQNILLADAERAFASQSTNGLPGGEFFYEHVHLTLEGNHLLARTVAEQIERLLPGRLAATVQPWPSVAECGRRLGWSEWARRAGWKGILPRLAKPPFTSQLNHPSQLQRAQAALAKPSGTAQATEIRDGLQACEEALGVSPDDPALLAQLASLKQAADDLSGAAVAARREVELLPGDAEGWAQLGMILARQRQFPDAVAAFQCAIELDPQDMVSREARAQSLAALGRVDEAIREFRHLLELKPNLGPAWLHFGQVLEQTGQRAEAEECYRKGLATRSQNLSALIELAGFCQARGWSAAAAEKYREAITLSPAEAQLHVGAGQNLAALKRYPEALEHAEAAVRLSPEFAEAHLLAGTILGQQGRLGEAAEKFREALRLKPELVDARLNLGLALMTQGRLAEATVEFEQVLQRDPNNTRALKHMQNLRAKAASRQ